MKVILFAIILCYTQTVFAQDKPANVLTPTQYKEKVKQEKGVVIDVRTPEEFAQGHVKNARNSDYRGGEFVKEMETLDKSKTYYLYCASGNRSGKALELMQQAGFSNVYNLGAYKDLEAGGLPVKKEKSTKKQN